MQPENFMANLHIDSNRFTWIFFFFFFKIFILVSHYLIIYLKPFVNTQKNLIDNVFDLRAICIVWCLSH